jgi:MFS family permease
MNTAIDNPSARQELLRSWPILLGAFLGVSAGVSALPYYTQGIFVPPLTGEFGWSREQMSLVTLAGGMVLAVASPLVGIMVDRVGVRVPLLCSFAAMALGYFALSVVGEPFLNFFALQVLVFATGAVTGPVAFTRVINQRFAAMRGLALGITLAGAGAMAVLAPPVVAEVISAIGWRGAYRAIAVSMIIAATLAVILLWPAGGRSGHRTAAARSIEADAQEELNVVLFWRLLVTFALLALGVGGFAFHLVPLLTDAGVSLTRAAGVQSLIGLSVLVGRLGSGYLVDRFFAPRIAALIMTLAAAGVAGLASLGPAAAPVCALLIGFALGTEGDIIGYLTARYFGLNRYGRLYGLLYGIFALGLGLSPVVMSRMLALSGSYSGALWASFAMLVLGALSMATLPHFRSDK